MYLFSLVYMVILCNRGLALGIALTVYGREEEADTLIEQMTRDQDPILRYGGMYALALAYQGTANNKAIRQLLHFAVSDVSDDVRRTAVLALGFVLYSEPEQVRVTMFSQFFFLLSCSHLLNCYSGVLSFFFPFGMINCLDLTMLLNRRLLELSHCYLSPTTPMFDMVLLLQ